MKQAVAAMAAFGLGRDASEAELELETSSGKLESRLEAASLGTKRERRCGPRLAHRIQAQDRERSLFMSIEG
jgi:hypothetical protein